VILGAGVEALERPRLLRADERDDVAVDEDRVGSVRGALTRFRCGWAGSDP
jgi:hypothetical protein